MKAEIKMGITSLLMSCMLKKKPSRSNSNAPSRKGWRFSLPLLDQQAGNLHLMRAVIFKSV
jgi:hypothetical protein